MSLDKILVGNDKVDFIEAVFPSMPGLEVEYVSDPEELVKRALTGEYGTVITAMDYTSLGKEGLQVLEALQDLDVRKVVWSWGNYAQADMARAAELGAEVIGKDDIREVLRQVVEKAYRPHPKKAKKKTRLRKYVERHAGIDLSRRKFLKWGGGVLLFTIVGGTVFKTLDCVMDDIDENSIYKLILKNTKLGDEYAATIKNAIKNVDLEEHPAVSIEDRMRLVAYQQSYEGSALLERLGKTIICTPESKFMDSFYKQMPKEVVSMIKSSVNYIVFSPDVIIDRNGDVNGLSVGQGLIFVDTVADDGGKKNPLIFPGTIAHESRHEKDKRRDLGVLLGEKNAYEVQAKVLRHQDASIDDAIIDADLSNVEARIDTAVYLEQFGNDFRSVYPNETILAKHFLDAGVSNDVLAKYASNQRDGDSKHNEELYHAARFAKIVRDNTREEALRQLYEVVTHPDKKDTLEQVSAASAIQYLAPNACKVESSADVSSGGGCQINFGGRTPTSGVGQGVSGAAGYGVSGMPALGDLVNDSEPSSSGSSDENVIEYRLEGSEYKLVKEGNKIVLYLPDQEGKPSPNFFRCVIRPADTDGNNIEDVIAVFYATNAFTHSDGSIIAKVDKYNADGNYVGSTLAFLGGRETGKDLPFNPSTDPQRLAREWNLERK